MPVSDRGRLGDVSQFTENHDLQAGCKCMILKTRRDVRVVEGARLEIALAVCDGVLEISITVASQPLNGDRVTSVDHRKLL